MPHAHPSGFPPRTFGRPQHGEGQALALREKAHLCSSGSPDPETGQDQAILTYRGEELWQPNAWRRTPARLRVWHARALAHRGKGMCFDSETPPGTVARGPSDATRASERVSPAIVRITAAWRGTGPRPTMKGGLSAAAAPGGAPPYCIETRRSLLPRGRGSCRSPRG